AASCRDGAGQVAIWTDPPEEGAENPALAEPLTASWPQAPAGAAYVAIREAATMVLDARAARDDTGAATAAEDAPEVDSARVGAVPERYADLVAGWEAAADLLLAERSGRPPDGPIQVDLPRRFGVSALVAMAKDPAQLAAAIRRPMPRPPAPRAERGTAFHRWLEERF